MCDFRTTEEIMKLYPNEIYCGEIPFNLAYEQRKSLANGIWFVPASGSFYMRVYDRQWEIIR